jgi:hypothetical protein
MLPSNSTPATAQRAVAAAHRRSPWGRVAATTAEVGSDVTVGIKDMNKPGRQALARDDSGTPSALHGTAAFETAIVAASWARLRPPTR